MAGESNLREDLVRLTQVLAGEGAKLMAAFAARQGLHPTDVAALTRILVAQEQGAALTAGGLAEELALTSGSVTSVLDRLERSGHVARVRDGKDRRKVLLHYLPGGRALADEFLVPFRRRAAVVMDRFTPDELDVVRRYLAATGADMAAYREVLQRRAKTTSSDSVRPGPALGG